MKYLHRSQKRVKCVISANSELKLISRKKYSNGLATTTHYIITQGRELTFFFSVLSSLLCLPLKNSSTRFYMLHSISLNIFNNKPRKILRDLIDTRQSVNETLLIFYPLTTFLRYQRTCCEPKTNSEDSWNAFSFIWTRLIYKLCAINFLLRQHERWM